MRFQEKYAMLAKMKVWMSKSTRGGASFPVSIYSCRFLARIGIFPFISLPNWLLSYLRFGRCQLIYFIPTGVSFASSLLTYNTGLVSDCYMSRRKLNLSDMNFIVWNTFQFFAARSVISHLLLCEHFFSYFLSYWSGPASVSWNFFLLTDRENFPIMFLLWSELSFLTLLQYECEYAETKNKKCLF